MQFVKDAEALSAADHVIFEGAQGILLDQDYGQAPHTTWSTTTAANAHALIDEIGFTGPVESIGVLRSYMTRHGDGPFPTEEPMAPWPAELHNETAFWQGPFRRGWLDIPSLQYALTCQPTRSATDMARLRARTIATKPR